MAEWLPRFSPYHVDLVDELAIEEGSRVLVPCCGTGGEVVAVLRELENGFVRATDPNAEMVRMAQERVAAAGFGNVVVERAAAEDASGGPWNTILCAFGLWQLDHRVDVLRAWKAALAPNGKLGVLTWGPPDENDPFELMAQCLREREPNVQVTPPRLLAARDSMNAMFDEAGLTLVRHTTFRHTLSFATAEAFVSALREARNWHDLWLQLGEERMGLVVARFYDRVGGVSAPLPWDPCATLAVAACPGDEIVLRSRPSIKVPPPA